MNHWLVIAVIDRSGYVPQELESRLLLSPRNFFPTVPVQLFVSPVAAR